MIVASLFEVLNSWWDWASFKAQVSTCLLSLSSMTHISSIRPHTTEPPSTLATFPELFYQHRAGRFSEGREQHTACHTSQLPQVHVTISVSTRELGTQPWPLVSSSGPLEFRLKTCCYCPTGVLGSGDGKYKLQIWPAFQEHHPSTWMPKPVGSQRRCNIENFHSPVNFSHTLWKTHWIWSCHTPICSPTPSCRVLKMPEFFLQ